MLKNVVRNIKFLSNNDLRFLKANSEEDNLKYEIYDSFKKIKIPIIKTIDQTIETLINTEKSLVRFGDGEFELLEGKSISFQESSQEISLRMKEVLSSKDDNIMIAIPKIIYEEKNNIPFHEKSFWNMNGIKYRKIIFDHCDFNRIYYNAQVTLAFSSYLRYDLETYFSKLQSIWNQKEIAIIIGNNIMKDIKYNIFDNASSVEYQIAPNRNAFGRYNLILENAKKIDKNKIIFIVLGPTATILAYDLAKEGYRALDIGHLIKSYDWYKKNKFIIQETAGEFFSPD